LLRSCRACDAKDETIRLLQEQLQQLWTHVGTPVLKKLEAPEVTPQGVEFDPWVSEEEQDIEHMRKHALISAQEAEAALAQVGAMNTTISFDG
jgi:hypothetical protein